MFRLDNILEQWAELYDPLSHNSPVDVPSGFPAGSPADGIKTTFFRTSTIDGNSYFIKHFAVQPSPAMAYATHIDAELAAQNPKAVSYRHVIYFLAKQQNAQGKTDITDEEAATEARFLCDDMVQDLLAVLFAMKSLANGKALQAEVVTELPEEVVTFLTTTAQDAQYREGLRGLQLDNAHWGTLPVHLNGWQICGLTIDQLAPRRLCISENRYQHLST